MPKVMSRRSLENPVCIESLDSSTKRHSSRYSGKIIGKNRMVSRTSLKNLVIQGQSVGSSADWKLLPTTNLKVLVERLEDSVKLKLDGATKKPDFKCALCQRKCSSKATLDDHIRRHLRERPFQCEICPKSFTAKYDLKLHTELHKFGKRFECSVCQKTYTVKARLKTHMRSTPGKSHLPAEFAT